MLGWVVSSKLYYFVERQGQYDVLISIGKKKKVQNVCVTSKWKVFPTVLPVTRWNNVLHSGILTLWALNFVVNLSKLSFFSSKITLKTLRKELLWFLIQNILSSNSSADKNSGKTPNRLLWPRVNHWPFLLPHLTKWRDLLWIKFFQTTEKLKGEKKSDEMIYIKFKLQDPSEEKKNEAFFSLGILFVEFFQILF